MMRPELWGGIECTRNRVGEGYFDQIERSGHARRLEDLRLFAALGLKKIRYPSLWEWVEPTPKTRTWDFIDRSLHGLQSANLDPIIGFLHHGSGPRFTNLMDADFPKRLADYAADFSRRYPWVRDFTPVNEPLTTARFSGLYGVWYPHARTDKAFIRCLIHQIKAIQLCMRAIRANRPDARLIQTEDLGRAMGTEPLQRQCDFENQRRWLSCDLLCGRVNEDHPLIGYLERSGFSPQWMDSLRETAIEPDILGWNHYPLSNRYLDHRLELYPKAFHGGNAELAYADLGAIDVSGIRNPSLSELLKEAWQRYRRPMAVTEVHVRGFRESQIRWLDRIWKETMSVIKEGVDVRAVTVWSLLGSYDWDSLCTQNKAFYEPGVFDLRNPDRKPRPTALARAVTRLLQHQDLADPVCQSSKPRRLLIIGRNGTLGRAFGRLAASRGIPHLLVGRSEMDIADPEKVKAILQEAKPWAVVNTAGYVKLDGAERERDLCFRENVTGAAVLADTCARLDLPLVSYSTDQVFNGQSEKAYHEGAVVDPLNYYGRCKAEAESYILSNVPRPLIIRASSFFGPWDNYNFIFQTLKSLREGVSVKVPNDIRISPTYVPDLVHATLDLLIDGARGLFHLTNPSDVSWAEFAQMAADLSPNSVSRSMIQEVSVDELQWPAKRPKQSVLVSEKVNWLEPLDQALARFFVDINAAGALS